MRHIALAAVLLAASPALAAEQGVLTYHNSNTRHGLYTAPGLTPTAAAGIHADPAFHASFSGNVYAQPLFWRSKTAGNLVIVATENNLILGLNADTGAVVWQNQLPAAVTGQLPCGNINPEGVTGTPAIDPATGTLYFNSASQASGVPRHMVYALSADTGQVVPGWPLDVQAALAAQGQTFDSTVQGDRSAVLFFKGNLYVSYGGRAGDCGSYHGDVVQIQTTGPAVTGYWSTRAVGGGIWSQGGTSGDGQYVFTTTGNTFNANNVWQDGEAILRLRPGLAHSTDPADFYTPTNWQTLDNEDADLGGTEALPMNIGGAPRLIALGKDGSAYLVSRSKLGGIGGEIASAKVSGSAIITAPAVYNTPSSTLVAFTGQALQNCSGNSIITLGLSASGSSPIAINWCAALNGRGSPIITTTDGTSNPLVWVTGAEGDNELHAFDAKTGAVVFGGANTAMQGLRHFGTLIAANHHLYVGADNTVYSFAY